MARYICEERYKENAAFASKIMGLAIGEVTKMQNKGDLPEGEGQFVASVQAHMNAQLHLHQIDASCEIKESVDGIDPSHACPDLSDLESATRRGFDGIKDAVEELKDAVDRIDAEDARPDLSGLESATQFGFQELSNAVDRIDAVTNDRDEPLRNYVKGLKDEVQAGFDAVVEAIRRKDSRPWVER